MNKKFGKPVTCAVLVKKKSCARIEVFRDRKGSWLLSTSRDNGKTFADLAMTNSAMNAMLGCILALRNPVKDGPAEHARPRNLSAQLNQAQATLKRNPTAMNTRNHAYVISSKGKIEHFAYITMEEGLPGTTLFVEASHRFSANRGVSLAIGENATPEAIRKAIDLLSQYLP